MFIGDREERITFEKLYDKYEKYLYYIALSITRDQYLAEDAVQCCCIRIIKNIDKFKDLDSEHTKFYLGAMIRNAAIDICRKSQKDRSLQDEADPELLVAEDNMSELFAQKELTDKIKKYMLLLKEEYGEILALKYYYGCSNKEIAEMLGTTEGNVRIRIYRAKRRLQKLIMENEGDRIFDYLK